MSIPAAASDDRTANRSVDFANDSGAADAHDHFDARDGLDRPTILASGATLLDWALDDQQHLSAVERFSQAHVHDGPPHREQFYRALLPASPPGAGEQYAFEVDLDRCSGCKACVTACHTLNGLDEKETWRDVGLLIGGGESLPVLQHVTTACHHCLEPACLAGCPVNAYEKDVVTGIVKHLDDQCIGCQYCTLACPYEAPKYHPGKGIVRKCDMCSSRLSVGEGPACVQACPNQAIAIRVVKKRQVIEDAETTQFLPAAPDPQLTLPTTIFKTSKTLPRNMLPADYFRVNPQHAHWPLVVMLVLTQLSVGAFTAGLMLDAWLEQPVVAALRPLHVAGALVFGLLALGSSTLHLGRAAICVSVAGLRHSWLSREIVAFGLFAKLACAYAAAVFFTRDAPAATVPWVAWLGCSVALSGSFGVFCSVMIYVFTGRECWNFTRVAVRFILTSALLGLAAIWLSVLALTVVSPSEALTDLVRHNGGSLWRGVMIAATLKLLWDVAILRHLWSRRMTPLKRSAMLMVGELANVTLARFAAGLLGGLLMPAMLGFGILTMPADGNPVRFAVIAGILFVACLCGEILERYLFFAACATPRMPGGIR